MDLYTAVMLVEGAQEPETEEQSIEAWQFLINTGIAWQLQGWVGRGAMHMLELGLCTLPEDC